MDFNETIISFNLLGLCICLHVGSVHIDFALGATEQSRQLVREHNGTEQAIFEFTANDVKTQKLNSVHAV